MPNAAVSPRRIAGLAWRSARAFAGIEASEPAILIYHRIASPPFDPWGLCVSAERFRQQLAALKAHRTVLSMDQLAEALDAGRVPPRATALTFDDGYADNADTAKPILEEMGVAATFFLTTGFVGGGAPFWWDELADLVLTGRKAASFDFAVAGTRLAARWGEQPALPADLIKWRVADPTADPRRLAYVRLWTALQAMTADERALAMNELRACLGESAPGTGGDRALPMSSEAARGLPSAFVSVGSHGRTHTPLPKLARDRLDQEIAGGRADIAGINGRAPSGFAYPHGEWDAAASEAVARAGFRWAVTTTSAKVNCRRYDLFALPRVVVGNWSARRLLLHLRTVGPLRSEASA